MAEISWVDEVGNAVEIEIERLYEFAKEIADEFYSVLAEANEKAKTNRTRGSHLTVRVRRKGNSVYIEWQSYYFYKREGGQWGRGFEHIQKARDSTRYPARSLQKHCNDNDVIEAVEKAEQQFAVIREYAAKLVKLRSQASTIDRFYEKHRATLADHEQAGLDGLGEEVNEEGLV